MLDDVLSAGRTQLVVHGSLALGGFDVITSDVDVLALVDDTASIQSTVWQSLGDRLAALRFPGRGLELSVVDQRAAADPRRPWPFLLHLANGPAGERVVVGRPDQGDPDLLMHEAVARAHGIGDGDVPVADVSGEVDRRIVLGYLADELTWAGQHAGEAYLVLNAGRALRYLPRRRHRVEAGRCGNGRRRRRTGGDRRAGARGAAGNDGRPSTHCARPAVREGCSAAAGHGRPLSDGRSTPRVSRRHHGWRDDVRFDTLDDPRLRSPSTCPRGCRPRRSGPVGGRAARLAAVADRPAVPDEMLRRLRATCAAFPEITEERAWVGVRWQVGKATVAHVFGGEDQRFRVTLRAELDEVLAFEHLGEPYFRAGWGRNVVGLRPRRRHGLGRGRRAADRLVLHPGPDPPRCAGAATELNLVTHPLVMPGGLVGRDPAPDR